MQARYTSALVLLTLLLLAPQVSAEDGVRWQPSLDDARKVAAESNRLVLVHFWAPWCGPCQRLEHQVFTQDATQKGLEANFVAVKMNADYYPAKARQWGVDSLPTDVILRPDGQFVTRLKVSGSSSVDQYLAQLSQVPGINKPASTMIAQASAKAPAPAAAIPAAPEVAPTPEPVQQQEVAASAPSEPAFEPAQASAPSWAVAGRSQAQPWMPEVAAAPQSTNCPWPGSSAAPEAKESTAAPAQETYAQQQPASKPEISWSQPQQTAVAPQAAVVAQQPTPPAPQVVAKATAPAPAPTPIGLEGYCPVTLVEQQAWVAGDRRWGAIHRGRTYLFTSADRQQRFLANPDNYSPVLSGNDPVVALSRGIAVPGRREFGVFFNGRIYLFTDEVSLKQFSQAPHRYEAEVLQVERPPQTVTR